MAGHRVEALPHALDRAARELPPDGVGEAARNGRLFRCRGIPPRVGGHAVHDALHARLLGRAYLVDVPTYLPRYLLIPGKKTASTLGWRSSYMLSVWL